MTEPLTIGDSNREASEWETYCDRGPCSGPLDHDGKCTL